MSFLRTGVPIARDFSRDGVEKSKDPYRAGTAWDATGNSSHVSLLIQERVVTQEDTGAEARL